MQFIKPTWPAPKNICAFTTTRQRGSSLHPFSSLNLANDVGDNPAHVTSNRQFLASTLNLPSEPVWLHQVHSAQVICLDTENRFNNPCADATVTHSSNIVCAVMTADCLPILICDKKGTAAAAIHAGWRGLAKGVIENAFQALNKQPDELLTWLGPAIGPKCFEVSNDVLDCFIDEDRAANTCFTKKANTSGKWLANIYSLAKQRLNRLGINAIYGGEYCTFTDHENFYSYRRDHGITGRMATLIWLSA
jgi:polyphenol oxidase